MSHLRNLTNAVVQSFLSSRRCQSAISSCGLHSMCREMQIMDVQKERKRMRDKIDMQGAVCKRPYRDGDTHSIPSCESNQDSHWAFFFFYPFLISVSTAPHCSLGPHSMHGQRSSLAGSTLPSHMLKVTYLRERSGSSLISDLQVPASP